MEGEPGFALLASSGVTYENVQPDGPSGIRELLAAPYGQSLASELVTKGYAAAAILGSAERAPTLEGVEIDSTPGAARLLAGSFAWMAGASVLVGPGKPLLTALGLGVADRTPAQIAAAAKRWLTAWRMQRAPAPFFLYVDFGATDGVDRRDAVETAILDLLGLLEQLDVDRRTAIVVASEPYAHPGMTADAPAPFAAAVRPASDGPQTARGVRVRAAVRARALGAELLELADRDSRASSPPLPGDSP